MPRLLLLHYEFQGFYPSSLMQQISLFLYEQLAFDLTPSNHSESFLLATLPLCAHFHTACWTVLTALPYHLPLSQSPNVNHLLSYHLHLNRYEVIDLQDPKLNLHHQMCLHLDRCLNEHHSDHLSQVLYHVDFGN